MDTPKPQPYFLPNMPPGRCPHCGGPMSARRAATSRRDNKTKVCEQCGVAEAMMAAGALINDATFAAIMLETRQAAHDHPEPEDLGDEAPGS